MKFAIQMGRIVRLNHLMLELKMHGLQFGVEMCPFCLIHPQMCGQMDINAFHSEDLIKWQFWLRYYIQSSKHNKPYPWLNETSFYFFRVNLRLRSIRLVSCLDNLQTMTSIFLEDLLRLICIIPPCLHFFLVFQFTLLLPRPVKLFDRTCFLNTWTLANPTQW